MKAKAIRLPENLLDAVSFVEEKEKIDEPTALRKLLKMGIENYVVELYSKGDLTLREVAKILNVSLREAMEIIWQSGVKGNVKAAQALRSLGVASGR
jgi:predicted HTH domain antitoxin